MKNLGGKIKNMKKRYKVLLVILGIILIWNHLPYRYDVEGAADYATAHTRANSKSWCAWYVMRAMQSGGGCPIGLLPAYAYNKTLPQMGFDEVANENAKGFTPLKGDVAVLPKNAASPFGHIAIWNGKQWVSDFAQGSIYPSTPYRANVKYQIFRATNGWHWKHVWTHPGDWFGWIQALVKGIGRLF